MNYIIDEIVKINVDGKEMDTTFKKHVNSLCIKSFSTLNGRVEAVRKLLKLKYNVPIYVNEKILLFKVVSCKTYWINYFNIKDIDIKNNISIIIFNNLEILELDVSKRVIVNRVRVCHKILDHKNKGLYIF